MSMMSMVTRAMAATRVMVTTVTALVSAAARTGAGSRTVPSRRAAALLKHRRRGVRAHGNSHPVGLIRPQYLPALAQARSLRLRMAHLSVTTPRRH
jgi:hypothetical protein